MFVVCVRSSTTNCALHCINDIMIFDGYSCACVIPMLLVRGDEVSVESFLRLLTGRTLPGTPPSKVCLENVGGWFFPVVLFFRGKMGRIGFLSFIGEIHECDKWTDFFTSGTDEVANVFFC